MTAWKPSTQVLLFITTVALAPGCPSETGSEDTATEGIDSASGTDPSTGMTTTPNPTSTTMDSDSATSGSDASTSGSGSSGSAESSGSGSSGSGSDGSSSGGPDTTGTGGGQTIIDCGNQTYACGDLEDNDGDGFIDLFDPECTGPCDDDETSFATGIPGDNMDCNQDCFFDGDSGAGNDGCEWNLRCDPANPGANIGCEYNGGGGNCPDVVGFSDECIEVCSPLTPPGCDCFGCCTVETDEGSVDIFLNSNDDCDPDFPETCCSLSNLAACETCTSQIDECGNPCDADGCELCFGETELPPGCDNNSCDNGDSCSNDGDCPDFNYCYLGCCYPLPG